MAFTRDNFLPEAKTTWLHDISGAATSISLQKAITPFDNFRKTVGIPLLHRFIMASPLFPDTTGQALQENSLLRDFDGILAFEKTMGLKMVPGILPEIGDG